MLGLQAGVLSLHASASAREDGVGGVEDVAAHHGWGGVRAEQGLQVAQGPVDVVRGRVMVALDGDQDLRAVVLARRWRATGASTSDGR